MKKKRLHIVLLMTILAVSVITAQGLLAWGQDKAVTIALQEKNITLYSPFEIIGTTMFRDGGTIAIVIEDSAVISLPFCLDGRIKRPSPLRHLYIGGNTSQ